MEAFRYDITPPTRTDGGVTRAQVGSKGQVLVQQVDANGTSIAPAVGAGTAAAAARVVVATDQTAIRVTPDATQYETVADGVTDQVLGTTGAVGDHIKRVIVIPTAVAAGGVNLTDGAVVMNLYLGGTITAELRPIFYELGMNSVDGAWKITTGANVKVIAIGRFT